MWHRYWVAQRTQFYSGIGLGADVLDYHWQKPEELAHYARACVDILFKFPFGTEELEGIAARGDFDLTPAPETFRQTDGDFRRRTCAPRATKLTPRRSRTFVAEVQEDWNDHNKSARGSRRRFARNCSGGVYHAARHRAIRRPGPDDAGRALRRVSRRTKDWTPRARRRQRIVLRFHPRVAPFKVGVFPLLKNKPELVTKAREVFAICCVQNIRLLLRRRRRHWPPLRPPG